MTIWKYKETLEFVILYKCNIFAFSVEPRVPNKIATWKTTAAIT